MGKMFIQIYVDYAVLPSSLNAISLCGILQFQPVLRQKQYLAAFIHAQKSLPGASRFPVGNPFTAHHITYAHSADGRVSKPDQISHQRGLSTHKGAEPSTANSRLTVMPHTLQFQFPNHWDAQNTCFYNEKILRRGRTLFNNQDHKGAHLFLFSQWTRHILNSAIWRLITNCRLYQPLSSHLPLWLPDLWTTHCSLATAPKAGQEKKKQTHTVSSAPCQELSVNRIWKLFIKLRLWDYEQMSITCGPPAL